MGIEPLSVVTNFCNEAGNLTDFLESLRHQTYSDFELVLVDDGSTDNSLETIRKYKRSLNMKLHRLQHVGLTAAREFGVRRSQGDIILTVDADEILERSALERIVHHFEIPSVGAVGGQIKLKGEKWFNRASEIIAEWSFRIRQELPSYRYVFGGCAAYRRKCLESIGGLVTGNIGEDADASWKIRKHGWEIVLDDKIVVWHKEPTNFKAYLRKMLSARTRNATTYQAHRQQMVIALKHYLPRIPLIFKVQGSAKDRVLAYLLFLIDAIGLGMQLLSS